ncbi:MAG: polysaccharide pyruvyl transferase family protein [Christensenellales bacterium]
MNNSNISFANYNADIVIHAPGGPSLGEIYRSGEIPYIVRLLLTVFNKKSLFFYAPSMGPFDKGFRTMLRKYILKRADCIVLREEISGDYVRGLCVNKNTHVTLDAVIQNKTNEEANKRLLLNNEKLNNFLSNEKKIIGLTITDLLWHPKHINDTSLANRINKIFADFVVCLLRRNYKVLFITQLFGNEDDFSYMNRFMIENEDCYILKDDYDCSFRQYVISKIYALVGMRCHSNIFAANVSTPFVSISYEHKMQGFLRKINMHDFCLSAFDFDKQKLIHMFEKMVENYEEIKNHLNRVKADLIKESKRTIDLLVMTLEKNRNVL